MADELMPLRSGTMKRRQKVTSQAITPGSTGQPIELPRVGFLASIYVIVRGTVTLSGAGSLADLGPWNLLKRLSVELNLGSTQLVSISGYMSNHFHGLLNRAWLPNLAGAGATTPHADQYVAPVASGANTVVIPFKVPISLNSEAEFDIGAINLQAPEVRCTITLDWDAVTAYAALATASSLTADVYYEYFEVPDPRAYAMPPAVLVRLIEEQMPITGVGDNVYQIPRQGSLLNMLSMVRLNGSRSDSIDSFELKVNKTDSVQKLERRWLRDIYREISGVDMPNGLYALQNYNSGGIQNSGDARDLINTEAITTLEWIATVSSGATLGSNNNFLHTARRIMQQLVY